MLASAAVGTVGKSCDGDWILCISNFKTIFGLTYVYFLPATEYRSMTEPIRITNPSIDNYVEGRATSIDVENRCVSVRLTAEGISSTGKINNYVDDTSNVIEIPYDHLICAVGTKVRSSIVPGAEEHCFNLKTAQDSKVLRTAVQEALESACRADLEGWGELADQKRWRRVAFVIIGGGPTGVELAGELNDFLLDICQPRTGPYSRLLNDFSITLIHGGEDLLPQFDKELRHRALQALEARGVEVRLSTRVEEVGKKYVTLRRKGGYDAETIPSGVTVWAAGNEPVPLLKDLLSQLPESAVGTAGRIKVDKWLRCPTHTPESFGSIFVIGDAGDMTPPNGKRGPTSSLPQTAQVAGQQGGFMARMFNRGYDLTQTPPKLPEFDKLSQLRVWLLVRGLEEAPDFVFLNLGLLAYVGGGEALTQVQAGDVPIIGLAGKGVFALWRSVYLAKQASSKNRGQLVFDWAKSQSPYGRDLTRL
jgi:NADH dehydrogenase FAD-containing subunit